MPFAAMKVLEIAGEDILVNQNGEKLIPFEHIFAVCLEIGDIDCVFVEDVMYEPQIVEVSRHLAQEAPVELFVERQPSALLEHLVDRVRAVDDRDDWNEEFEELRPVGVDEHVVAKRIQEADRPPHTGICVHQAVYLAQRYENLGVVEPVEVFDDNQVVARRLEEIDYLVEVAIEN